MLDAEHITDLLADDRPRGSRRDPLAPRMEALVQRAVAEQGAEQRMLRESLAEIADGLASLERSLFERLGLVESRLGRLGDGATPLEQRVVRRLRRVEKTAGKLARALEQAEQRILATAEVAAGGTGTLADRVAALEEATGELARQLTRALHRLPRLVQSSLVANEPFPGFAPVADSEANGGHSEATGDDAGRRARPLRVRRGG